MLIKCEAVLRQSSDAQSNDMTLRMLQNAWTNNTLEYLQLIKECPVLVRLEKRNSMSRYLCEQNDALVYKGTLNCHFQALQALTCMYYKKAVQIDANTRVNFAKPSQLHLPT